DRQGTLSGLSAIARDVSPVVLANQELEERQREVRALLELAEENSRRREQFLAMLSHELRNPLAAVLNASAVLEEHAVEPGVARCHAVIARQAAHMKRLLDDLLDVSRITRGKFALHTEDIDLRNPIQTAIETTAPLVVERKIELHTDLPITPMPVRGDVGRLVQAVGNLLANACYYSPSRSRVDLEVTPEGRFAVIRVRDRGVGITREMLPRIFELFVQSEHRMGSHGGLGVGLSLAQSIVERHGGTLVAESDGPGTGSTFTISIPLREVLAKPTEPHARAERPPAHRPGGRSGRRPRDDADVARGPAAPRDGRRGWRDRDRAHRT
ncbi:MAG: HAMP domain-containing histidine kinase, partial [Deltaproteobacteria bacterium]|nr:HAMP domain-containing histidine kinase [Deltaproteobacteria bacterium]